jgi:hypothetical protein
MLCEGVNTPEYKKWIFDGPEGILPMSETFFIRPGGFTGPDANNIYTVTEFVNNGGNATTFKTGTTNGYKSITIVRIA